jgi:hypothetical protein
MAVEAAKRLRMSGLEHARIGLCHVSKDTRQDAFVAPEELGSTRLMRSSVERFADSRNRYLRRWRDAVRDPSTSFALLTSLTMTKKARTLQKIRATVCRFAAHAQCE